MWSHVLNPDFSWYHLSTTGCYRRVHPVADDGGCCGRRLAGVEGRDWRRSWVIYDCWFHASNVAKCRKERVVPEEEMVLVHIHHGVAGAYGGPVCVRELRGGHWYEYKGYKWDDRPAL